MAADCVYDRAALLNKLKLVQPAIAKPNAAQVASTFENVWLTDYGLLASNDVIAMATPLDETVTVGGVHGGKLIGLISNCDAEIVRFGDGDGHLRVNGGFKATLAVDRGDPPFVWPQPDEGSVPIMVDKDMAKALKFCVDIADPSSWSIAARGVTVIQGGGGLLLYATDRKCLLRFVYSDCGDYRLALLTIPFVEQVVKLAPGMLWLQDGYAMFEGDAGGVWGRLLHDPKQPDFEDLRTRLMPKYSTELPDGFGNAVLRAGLMATAEAKGVPVRLTIASSHLQLFADSASGELFDTLPFDHPPMSMRFDQKQVLRMLDHGFTHLGVSNKSMLFTSSGADAEYLIAAYD